MSDPESKTVRVAVVGVGHLGSAHARIYSELSGVDLVAVCDILSDRAAEIARRCTTTAVTDYRDLFDRVDAVSIAVPTSGHYAIAREFIAAGIPVLVEKPLTTSLEEAHALVELARTHNTMMQVGHVERFNPAFEALERLDVRPRFIEAHRLSPFSFRSADVGVVLDLMIHDLDIVRHLARSPLVHVDAVGVNVIGRHEDIANARLTFENGCVANVTASRVAIKKMRRVRLFARDCYVAIDTGAIHGLIIKKSPEFPIDGLDLENFDAGGIGDLTEYFLKDLLHVEELRIDPHEPLSGELAHFVECVRTGETPKVPGEEGEAALELAEQVLRAIGEHEWLDDLGRRHKGPPGPGPPPAPDSD